MGMRTLEQLPLLLRVFRGWRHRSLLLQRFDNPTADSIDHPHIVRISLSCTDQPPGFGKPVIETPVILIVTVRMVVEPLGVLVRLHDLDHGLVQSESQAAKLLGVPCLEVRRGSLNAL